MTVNEFFFPIPQENLIKRFTPVFKKISGGNSATLLALPYTGRTSHLRFLVSQQELLEKLGIYHSDIVLALADIDKTTGTFESYILELIHSIETATNIKLRDKRSYLTSQDAYLLSQYLFLLAAEVTKTIKINLIVVLNEKIKEVISEIDNLLVQVQKSAHNGRLNILWSIDTVVLRNYVQGHPSSTILENIFYFPTFSTKETVHSAKRIAETKGVRIDNSKLKKIMSLTGGIAGLFHQFVTSDNFIESDSSQAIIKILKREIDFHQSIIKNLITNEGLDFIINTKITKIKHKKIHFLETPTAHEILLTDLFTSNINEPVSRDEIAKTIWGKNWEKKYSDWAIDKSISRLRNNLGSKDYKIITVKNLGYQLYKLS